MEGEAGLPLSNQETATLRRGAMAPFKSHDYPLTDPLMRFASTKVCGRGGIAVIMMSWCGMQENIIASCLTPSI